jgi:dolichol-phosphate mannosyltransferase
MKKSVYIITPVYNEDTNLELLTEGWRNIQNTWFEYDVQFILVDDGSTDKTSELALTLTKDLNFKLITHEVNKGPGYAFGSGFEYISDSIKEEDIVVTIEGDNTSRLDTLKIMIERILREDIDVAFASPLAYGGTVINTYWHRRFLGHAAAALTKIVLNIHGIHTFTSFFRAYQGKTIILLQKKYGNRILEFNGFECMVELLKKMTLINASITEVPMQLDTSIRKGKSKLKIWKTALLYFVLFKRSRKW